MEYYFEYHRTYGPGDYDAAEYLSLRHQTLLSEDQERDNEGRLTLPAGSAWAGIRIGCVLFQATVVSDDLRREIEHSGLIGPQFKQTTVDAKVSSELWEVVSSIILPPMPKERLVCRPISPGNYLDVSGIRDGDYVDKEVHYASGEIRRVEPFDFALTLERFGGEQWPIVSQRFRQFYLKRTLDLSWTPVRIDARIVPETAETPDAKQHILKTSVVRQK